jgi:hypothetical protein
MRLSANLDSTVRELKFAFRGGIVSISTKKKRKREKIKEKYKINLKLLYQGLFAYASKIFKLLKVNK